MNQELILSEKIDSASIKALKKEDFHSAYSFLSVFEKTELYPYYMDKSFKEIRGIDNKMNSVYKEIAEHFSGIKDIPDQYQKEVKRLAWEYGHSSGITEYYNYLIDLVGIFKKN